MKSIAWLAVTAMAWCSLALAQEQKPAAAEAAKPAAAQAATPSTTPARKVRRTVDARRRTEDARHCLGRPSNTEIIKCAEAYL